MQRPFIMVAPNGARRGPADHPALPIALPQIVSTAAACHAAGADALHLHIRDGQGAHTLDPGRYLETLSELRKQAPTLQVQITTEAAGLFDVPTQLACLQIVRPAWASIALREIARTPDLADRIYGTCAANGTRVQHILYDTDDYQQFLDWHARGIVRTDQTDLLFVLGRYLTNRSSQPADLHPFLAALTNAAPWMVCAFGATEHDCLTYAANHGGDLRVGFENSLTAPDGTPWRDCAASVSALVAALETSNIESHAKHPAPIGG